MGIIFECKGKDILDLSNLTFGALHDKMVAIVHRSKTKPSNLSAFLEETNQDIYGIGMVGKDITDYFKTKREVIELANLVKQALDEEQKSNYPFSQEAYERIINFYNELLKYAETLKD